MPSALDGATSTIDPPLALLPPCKTATSSTTEHVHINQRITLVQYPCLSRWIQSRTAIANSLQLAGFRAPESRETGQSPSGGDRRLTPASMLPHLTVPPPGHSVGVRHGQFLRGTPASKVRGYPGALPHVHRLCSRPAPTQRSSHQPVRHLLT